MEGALIGEDASEIQHAFFNSFEEMVEHVDDIICYLDCYDMSDVAYYLIQDTGTLVDIPAHMKDYIDYEAYGRDLEIEVNFIFTNKGIFEYST